MMEWATDSDMVPGGQMEPPEDGEAGDWRPETRWVDNWTDQGTASGERENSIAEDGEHLALPTDRLFQSPRDHRVSQQDSDSGVFEVQVTLTLTTLLDHAISIKLGAMAPSCRFLGVEADKARTHPTRWKSGRVVLSLLSNFSTPIPSIIAQERKRKQKSITSVRRVDQRRFKYDHANAAPRLPDAKQPLWTLDLPDQRKITRRAPPAAQVCPMAHDKK
ncbi:hypothetical protein PDE_05705 [Penicillium oxalicum 114-2]|uniref:Uncharacterized protein n=1 Tax=Penicillium oxalicum (strain 114-2 / CGMCC 5302) TaxID=933388 RepID=S8AWS4_PENO1|nr:hypothetical protein PDE_05705 [Penicillium oxalicum 114-2]